MGRVEAMKGYFGNDPLYNAVLEAYDTDSFRRSAYVLDKIRGRGSYNKIAALATAMSKHEALHKEIVWNQTCDKAINEILEQEG